MRQFIAMLLASLSLAVGCDSEPPVVSPLVKGGNGAFRSIDYGFQAAFLEQPEISSKLVRGGPGQIPAVEYLHVDENADLLYMISCHTYPDPFAESMITQNLNAARDRFEYRSKCKLLKEQDATVGDYPARECWFQKSDGVLFHCLFAFHRNRDFKVAVAYGDDERSEELAEDFIRSFMFLD